MKKFLTTFGLVVGMTLSSAASATIIGGAITGGSALSKGAEFIDLGYSPAGLVIGNNTIQNPNLYGFNEDQNIYLGSDLDIDVGGASIAAGQEVASHYIFFDPRRGTTVTGWVDFDSEILGIITGTDKLADSDFLINNDVTYLNPTLRGLEDGQDVAWIDPLNVNRLSLAFYASSPGDYIRVITAHSPQASVPEPTTAALMMLGLLGLGSRFKKMKA